MAGLVASACAGQADVELTAAIAPTTTSTTTQTEPDVTPAAPDDDVDVDVDAVEEAAGPEAGPAPETTLPDTALLAGGVDPSTLTTEPNGAIAVQPTPPALQRRALPTVPLLPPPASDAFEFTIEPFEGDPLARSTWNELCPVPASSLSYLTVSFWGFDGLHHTGELVVAANEAENVVSVFRRLHAIRFPIEEMRIVTPTDVVAVGTGDVNNTSSFVCRLTTGGSRFSEHAFGLAIDINPFQNPYQKDDLVIPALASSYLDRADLRPGMIVRGDPAGDEVIAAFADIGWRWGGDWNSLKDYTHFTRNNR